MRLVLPSTFSFPLVLPFFDIFFFSNDIRLYINCPEKNLIALCYMIMTVNKLIISFVINEFQHKKVIVGNLRECEKGCLIFQ